MDDNPYPELYIDGKTQVSKTEIWRKRQTKGYVAIDDNHSFAVSSTIIIKK